MKFRHLLFSLCLLFSTVCLSQKEQNNWYFGYGAAITFNNVAPTALSNSAMQQHEGSATISDRNGNLLFYTNGVTVWNKNHTTMLNGTGLGGENVSAQSALIVPMPLHDSIYYVFTVSNWYGGALQYSIVNMNLDNGNGAVTTKNTLINSLCREQLNAVYNKNCKDVWILSHEINNTNFVAYQLTDTGLVATAVTSSIGMNYMGSNRYGYLKFSPDGNKLCSALGGDATGPTVQLYDFDRATGIISKPITIATANSITDAYSSEFSPNGTKLYVTSYNSTFIYQYDLSFANETDIVASKTDVGYGASVKACPLLGPDNKIYVALSGYSYLGTINSPDSAGTKSNYTDTGVFLNNKIAHLGLPNFFHTPHIPINIGNDTSVCASHPIILDATTANATYHWQDGTTASAYQVTQNGVYSVTVSLYSCKGSDSAVISIGSLPPLTITPNRTIFCSNDSAEICAPTGFQTYLWNIADSGNCIKVKQAGNYYVTVTDMNGCSVESNHVAINVYPTPSVSIIVAADTFTSYGQISYQWIKNGIPITGATSPTYIAVEQGQYSVQVTDANGCMATSSPITYTGIENIENNMLQIYPNPTSDNWLVWVGDNLIGSRIEIYDEPGGLVYQSLISNSKFSIKLNISSGIYMAHIHSPKISIVRKLIKF